MGKKLKTLQLMMQSLEEDPMAEDLMDNKLSAAVDESAEGKPELADTPWDQHRGSKDVGPDGRAYMKPL